MSQVKWCNRIGLRVAQILPVNDTSVRHDWRDSYPYKYDGISCSYCACIQPSGQPAEHRLDTAACGYAVASRADGVPVCSCCCSAVSVFALHPIYCCIEDIQGIPSSIAADAARLRAQLNRDPTAPVDYEAVMKAKSTLLRRIFEAIGEDTLTTDPAYKQFFDENKYVASTLPQPSAQASIEPHIAYQWYAWSHRKRVIRPPRASFLTSSARGFAGTGCSHMASSVCCATHTDHRIRVTGATWPPPTWYGPHSEHNSQSWGSESELVWGYW